MGLPFHRSGLGDLYCGVGVGRGRDAGGGVRGKVVVVVVHGRQMDQLLAPPEVSRSEGRRARSLPVRAVDQEVLDGSRGGHVCRRVVGTAGKATGSKGCRWTRWLRFRGCHRQRQDGSGLVRSWRPSPRMGRSGCSSIR